MTRLDDDAVNEMDDSLQRIFDGDIAGAPEASIEAHPQGPLRLEKLQHLQSRLRSHVASASSLSEEESGAMFEAIALRLKDAEAEQSAPVLRMVPRERWQPIVGTAAAFAVAAAVMLVYLGSAGPRSPRGLTRAAPVMTVTHDHLGSEVVEADFGSNIGTIFEVEGNSGEPIAVVWISDDALNGDLEPEETLQ